MKLLVVAAILQLSLVRGQKPPPICSNVLCLQGHRCVESVNGLPECVAVDPEKTPFAPPTWFNSVEKNFEGIRLKRCSQRHQQPEHGTSCSSKPKTCFFDTQVCQGTATPMTECFCDGDNGDRTWKCKAMKCSPTPSSDSCPQPVGIGLCVELCFKAGAGDDCPPGQICCSNGCGHVCLDPVVEPTIDSPTPDPPPIEPPKPPIEPSDDKCPPVTGAGICVEECSVAATATAGDDDDCTDGKICCSNGCGHVCTDPVNNSPITVVAPSN